jgi:aminodeoxyfutalosine synthase
MESQVMTVLEDIAEKLAAGQGLSRSDAERLLATKDLISVGVLADDVRRRINGDRVTFLRVLEVPPEGPLPLISPDTGEVRIAGLPADSERMIERVREVARVAGDVPISACALHELSGRLAERLRAAGVSHVAEAAVDRLLDRSVLNDVRSAGLDIARWTVQSYDPLPPLELLEQVRDLGPIPSFAPLPRAIDPSAPTTGYDDVKIVAVARLFLSKVNAISVDWSLYGPKLAQVALTFGSADLDAVPAESGAVNLLGPRRTALEEVRRNIRAAALTPVARDLRFRTLS